MKKITIHLNSDRCHVCIDGTPEQTFIFLSYPHKSEDQNKAHAIIDAKATAFDILAKFQREKVKAFIDTQSNF